MDIKRFDELYINQLSYLPSFFDLAGTDVRKIFGEKGNLIIFNILDLANKRDKDINENIVSNIVCNSINNVICKNLDVFSFKFGSNEFIVTIPNCNKDRVIKVSLEIEKEIEKAISALEGINGKLTKHFLVYDKKIDSLEAFMKCYLNVPRLSVDLKKVIGM